MSFDFPNFPSEGMEFKPANGPAYTYQKKKTWDGVVGDTVPPRQLRTVVPKPPFLGAVTLTVDPLKDTHFKQLDVYAITPAGSPLTSLTPKYSFPVKTLPGDPFDVVVGTPSPNIVENGDMAPAGPPPELWREWTFSGGRAVHGTAGSNFGMMSLDGDNWRATTMPTLVNVGWEGVAYSPTLDLFVAVSANASNVVNGASSRDGITWEGIPGLRTGINYRDICWGRDRFIAVTSTASHAIQVSTDGITWQTVVKDMQTWSVCYSPRLDIFVMVGDTGPIGQRVWTSTDGLTWTPRNSPDTQGWHTVCWSQDLDLFVALAQTGTGRCMTSPNGVDWTLAPIDPMVDGSAWRCVTWVKELGLFLAGATAGDTRIMSSKDGKVWTSRTTVSIGVRGIAWSPTLRRAVAVCTSGTSRVYASSNGINWFARQNGPWAQTWYWVVWSDYQKKFVAVGQTAGVNPEFIWAANEAPMPVGTILRGAVNLVSGGPVGLWVGNVQRDLLQTISALGETRFRVSLPRESSWVGLSADTGIAASVDDFSAFIERPGNLTPGDWDFFCFPTNVSGVQGPGLMVPNVHVP